MSLPDVALNDPHVAAHNAERQAINALQSLDDEEFVSNLTASIDAKAVDVSGRAGKNQTDQPRATVGFDPSNGFVVDGIADRVQLQSAAALATTSDTGVGIDVGPGVYDMDDVKVSAIALQTDSRIAGAGPATVLQNLTTYPTEGDVDGWGVIRIPPGSRRVQVADLSHRGDGAADATHTNVSGSAVTSSGSEATPNEEIQVTGQFINDGLHGVDLRVTAYANVSDVNSVNCQHPLYVWNSRRVNVHNFSAHLTIDTPTTMLQRGAFINCSQDVNLSNYHVENAFTTQLLLRTNEHYVGPGRASTRNILVSNFDAVNDRSTIPAGTPSGIEDGVIACEGVVLLVNVGTDEDGIENVIISTSRFATDEGAAVRGWYLASDGESLDAAIPPRIRRVKFVGVDLTQLSGAGSQPMAYFPAVVGLTGYSYQSLEFHGCTFDGVNGALFERVDGLTIKDCKLSTAGETGTLGRSLTIKDCKDVDITGNTLDSADASVALRVQGTVNGRIVGNTLLRGTALIDFATFTGDLDFPTGKTVKVNDANVTLTRLTPNVLYTAITANRTVTLPAANSVPAGWGFYVADGSNAAGGSTIINIVCSGSDTFFDASTSKTITTAGGTRKYQSDGVSKWVNIA